MATHHTPSGAVLDLELPAGRIEIETADTDTTTVELTPLAAGDAAALDAIAATQETERTDGDVTRVIVHVPKRRLGHEPELLMQVTAPRGSRAELETIAADIRARDGFASLRGKTVSGDIEAGAVSEDASLRTTSGDVSVASTGGSAEIQSVSGDLSIGSCGGGAVLKTTSGDVRLRAAESSVAASTISGDVEVVRARSGEVDMRSMSGDLAVGVARGSRVFLEVRTLSGDARSDLEISDTPASGDGPELTVRADTKSGDIRVRRAPEPAEVA